MLTGLYTRWELHWESGKFKPRQNKMKTFEIVAMSYFQRVRPQCKVENFHTEGTEKTIGAYSGDGFCGHCNNVFEAIGCYYHYRPCQEAFLSLTEDENQIRNKKRELDELRKQYIQKRVMTSLR